MVIALEQRDMDLLRLNQWAFRKSELFQDSRNALLAPNGLTFLFEEVRYELNGVVVDHVKNPGMTSTLKAYASLQPQEAAGLQMAGFCQPESQHDATFLTSDGSFSACIPLRHLLGFAEDHNRIVINMRQ